jgi:hypothetical protein
MTCSAGAVSGGRPSACSENRDRWPVAANRTTMSSQTRQRIGPTPRPSCGQGRGDGDGRKPHRNTTVGIGSAKRAQRWEAYPPFDGRSFRGPAAAPDRGRPARGGLPPPSVEFNSPPMRRTSSMERAVEQRKADQRCSSRVVVCFAGIWFEFAPTTSAAGHRRRRRAVQPRGASAGRSPAPAASRPAAPVMSPNPEEEAEVHALVTRRAPRQTRHQRRSAMISRMASCSSSATRPAPRARRVVRRPS